MSQTSRITPTERAIYDSYDQQRRLSLTRVIAPTFAVILALFLLILNVDGLFLPQIQSKLFSTARVVQSLYLADPLIGACVALFIFATVAARQGKVNAATACTISATNLAVILLEVIWSFRLSGFDYIGVATLSSFIIAIVLAGVLGDRWMVVVTTLFLNTLTVAVGLLAQPPHPLFEQDTSIADLASSQMVILLSGAVLVQWSVATVMLTTASAYRRTLRELGDVRVAFERAKQLDGLKDQFISSVNHELRSPVMAMQGYLELLKLTEETASSEKRRALLARASTASDNLAYLLTSILDARRLDQDADDFTPEPVNVRESVNAAAQLIDPREGQLVERELHVAIPAQLQVWGEQVRLQQILTNLLSNAIKYSEPGSPIEVSAQIVADSAPHSKTRRLEIHHFAEIIVRDHGLGIPPEQAPLLFQRFVRLPRDLASTTIGNGLGLFLCRVLAEAMHGSIQVDSTGIPGEGATFTVRLPLVVGEPSNSSRKTGPLSTQANTRKTSPLRDADAVKAGITKD